MVAPALLLLAWIVSAVQGSLGTTEQLPAAQDYQHQVHLRTGTLDLGQLAWSQRSARRSRSLAASAGPQQGTGGQSTHDHHISQAWGALATHSTYLLSLGPKAQSHEEQMRLKEGLEARGGAVTSFLPPFSLVVLAPPEAAEWLEEQPDTLLAAYPDDHKISPEWDRLLARLEEQQKAAAATDAAATSTEAASSSSQSTSDQPARSTVMAAHSAAQSAPNASLPLRSSHRHVSGKRGPNSDSDQSQLPRNYHHVDELERSQSVRESVRVPHLGEPRWHDSEQYSSSNTNKLQQVFTAPSVPNKHNSGVSIMQNSGTSSATTAKSKASQASSSSHALKPKLLIDVTFPELMPADLDRMGLEPRPGHWADVASYVDSLQDSSSALPGTTKPGSAAAAVAGIPSSSQRLGGRNGLGFTSGVSSASNASQPARGDVSDSGRARGVYFPAMAAAADWLGPIQEAAPHCGADILVEHGTLMVAACQEDVKSVLAWLAARPSVRWLSPRMKAIVHNLRASAITQTGYLLDGENDATLGKHPVWRAGITGSSQIIGIGDTGINMDSCYFADSNVSFTNGFTTNGQGIQVFSSTTHRKIRLYVALQDNIDGYGHGSHTGGTLAGAKQSPNPVTSPDPGTGISPFARISFLDLSRGDTSAIWTPGDLSSGYYPWSFSVGARIHSDSWGSDVAVYDSLSASVDRFVWANPSFLPFFAAGNYGDQTPSNGAGNASTITSPAVAKNSVAVGATLTYSPGYQADTSVGVLNMTLTIPIVGGGAGAAYVYSAPLVLGAFGADWGSLQSGGPLGLAGASPQDACTGLSGSYTGRVVIAMRGNCYFATKLQNAINAGAAALIVTDNGDEGYFYLTPSSQSDLSLTGAALGGVAQSVGRVLWYAANLGTSSGATITLGARQKATGGYDDLASFSSFGPTADGRIKPDIVAPGVVVSAATDYTLTGNIQCNTVQMMGTSMACPVAASSAALIRQFFTDGYYPTGTQNNANAVANPSGALIKAVMLAGASPLLGVVENGNPTAGGLPLEPGPGVRSGWGRVSLANSLPVPGGSGWRLQVVDSATLTQGQTHQYCVRASGGGPLRVVLVWADYPGDPAASSSLVNDLSLSVRAAGLGGMPLLGNGWNDTVNNAESVYVDNLPVGNVAITVSATRVVSAATPQPYALVVLGSFSGTLQSPFNPVGGSSNTSGTCAITLAYIDPNLSTQSLTSSKDIEFYFSTQSGSPAIGGFQCRLADQSGKTSPAPLHDWQSCTSPDKYSGVPDGHYTFSVRSAGEDVADSTSVTVDSTPPVSTITSSMNLVPSAGSNIVTTTTDNITFAFSASDMSPVTFTCFVSVTNNGGVNASYFRSLPGPTLPLSGGAPCTSPLTLQGLTYGRWSLTVQAVDAAGNVERTGTVLRWMEQYAANGVYTRYSTTPPLLTNNPNLQLSVYSFTGQGANAPTSLSTPSAGYEYQMWTTNTARPSTWTPVPSGASSLSANASSDGNWAVAVRVADATGRVNDSAAVTSVKVDTTPPKIAITSAPASIQSSPVVVIKFETQPADDTVVWKCRWLSSTSGAVPLNTPNSGATAYGACNGSTATSSSAAVSDGWWLFQVIATDEAGNTSPPTNVPFRTVTTPPIITNVTAPNATNTRALSISYQISQGPVSIGLANTTCSMRAVFLAPPSPAATAAASANPLPSGNYIQPSGNLQSPCPNPAQYALSEGRYVWTIQAVDNAGLQAQATYNIVYDLTPPVAGILTSPLASGVSVPSTFTLNFTAKDLPDGSASGIQYYECLLSTAGSASPPPGAPPAASSSSPSPASPTPSPSAQASGVSGTGRRALQQSGNPIRFANGAAVTLGQWQQCPSPVTYENMPSGSYIFKVRAVDNANNTGAATSSYNLQVDASLPIPTAGGGGGAPGGDDGGGGGIQANKVAIAVIAAVGGLVLIAVILAVIVVRRRILRRRGPSPPIPTVLLPPPPPAVHGAHYPPPPIAPYPSAPLPLLSSVAPNGGATGGSGTANGYPVAGYYANGTGGSSGRQYNGHDPYLAAAAAAQARSQREIQAQWEEERVRQAIQASLEEERTRKALEASRADEWKRVEEERLQAAIRASLAMHGQRLGIDPSSSSGDQGVSASQINLQPGPRW